ncbi:hypothetical protein CVT26_015162 [Gymnopilus dilepis]|uniref:Uncharacterized protein n=1 Tax=Gymnopilus dilepis TaxID=231916 RepID=A0A409WA53_9AGAR|nr:hypothetical protein CVT26_015162 [Gymnopilus dilepis]
MDKLKRLTNLLSVRQGLRGIFHPKYDVEHVQGDTEAAIDHTQRGQIFGRRVANAVERSTCEQNANLNDARPFAPVHFAIEFGCHRAGNARGARGFDISGEEGMGKLQTIVSLGSELRG